MAKQPFIAPEPRLGERSEDYLMRLTSAFCRWANESASENAPVDPLFEAMGEAQRRLKADRRGLLSEVESRKAFVGHLRDVIGAYGLAIVEAPPS